MITIVRNINKNCILFPNAASIAPKIIEKISITNSALRKYIINNLRLKGQIFNPYLSLSLLTLF